MSDPYERSAEYLDILIAESWEPLAPALADVLSRVRAGTGAVVDLGAGSGRGVRVICDALPRGPVLAVEPSAAMRAVLLARVHEDGELRERVTVVPGDCASADWPDGVRAVVALNMIGHLPPGHSPPAPPAPRYWPPTWAVSRHSRRRRPGSGTASWGAPCPTAGECGSTPSPSPSTPSPTCPPRPSGWPAPRAPVRDHGPVTSSW